MLPALNCKIGSKPNQTAVGERNEMPNLGIAMLKLRVIGIRWGFREPTWKSLRLRVLALRRIRKETW